MKARQNKNKPPPDGEGLLRPIEPVLTRYVRKKLSTHPADGQYEEYAYEKDWIIAAI